MRIGGRLGQEDEGKMIFQAPHQPSLCLHLAPGAGAAALISAADGWGAAAGAAPRAWHGRPAPSLPAPRSGAAASPPHSLQACGWKDGSSAGPSPPAGFISPFVSCPLLYAWVSPPHALTSLTFPAGNASCLATIILFSRWSALSSLPQLVSGPEAKGSTGRETMQNHSRVSPYA